MKRLDIKTPSLPFDLAVDTEWLANKMAETGLSAAECIDIELSEGIDKAMRSNGKKIFEAMRRLREIRGERPTADPKGSP